MLRNSFLNSNFSPLNNPLSLSFKSGITSKAIKGEVCLANLALKKVIQVSHLCLTFLRPSGSPECQIFVPSLHTPARSDRSNRPFLFQLEFFLHVGRAEWASQNLGFRWFRTITLRLSFTLPRRVQAHRV